MLRARDAMDRAYAEPLEFVLPGGRWGQLWSEVLRTGHGFARGGAVWKAGDRVSVRGRELILLRRS